jgi:NADH:ubiquinone reductase (H+-translocating)
MENTHSSELSKHVVIVGAGFAGLHCAMQLAEEPDIQITLLDRNNFQQFQPLLYQVATASLSPNDAAFNLRGVLGHHSNVEIVMTEVVSIDLATRTVQGSQGDLYTGDYLVLAAGAQANFFGIPGVADFSFPLYSLRDAERLRSRILEVLEAAEVAAGQGRERIPHFAVVGGGATGVEIAGALADILNGPVKKGYRHLDLGNVTITLINGQAEVLSGFNAKSRAYAQKILEERKVNLMLGRRVKELTRSELILDDESRIACDIAIWAGGLKAAPIAEKIDLKPGKGGRLDVQTDLQVPGFEGVYALGDFANIAADGGSTLPQLASVAQQSGRHCAHNIIAGIRGTEQKSFDYLDKGIMAMVGRNAAVAEVGSGHHSLTGPLAFAAWLGVHAVLLTTLRAKMGAFVEWAWDYFGDAHVDAILDFSGTAPGDMHSVPKATAEVRN